MKFFEIRVILTKMPFSKFVSYSESRRIFCFFVVGGMAALLHVGIAVGLVEYWDFGILLANLIGFLVAVNISFWGHYKWTFQSSTCIKNTYTRFFKIATLAFMISNVLLIFFVEANLVSDSAAIVVANLIIPISSFVINKTWTFT